MMAFSWERAISAQSCSKKSWSSAKSSLRWPSPRTFSSRIRVYLLLELALLRKYALFFCSKTKFTHKNLRHLLVGTIRTAAESPTAGLVGVKSPPSKTEDGVRAQERSLVYRPVLNVAEYLR